MLAGQPTNEDNPPLGDSADRSSARSAVLAPHPGGIVAVRGMPQTKVANLVETARQHMLEEATHEFVAAEAADSCLASLALLVLDWMNWVLRYITPRRPSRRAGQSGGPGWAPQIVRRHFVIGIDRPVFFQSRPAQGQSTSHS
jgi:hypothetical protein